jgi:hypothetical protein
MELTLSLMALGVVTWVEWWLSTPAGRHPRWSENVLPTIVLFLAWWFLVVRLIHGEALAGDRQFWITRPYVWHKLLAAKILFVFAWIALPLACSQILLIALTGASVVQHLMPILRDTALAILSGILPIAAIAAITRNLVQWAMYCAAIILVCIGFVWLDSAVPNSRISLGSDITDDLQGAAVACLCGGGIAVQYAFRRTLWGTLLVAATIVSIPVIVISTPYLRLIHSAYPLLSEFPAPVHAVFGEDQSAKIGASRTWNGETELIVPIELSVPRDSTLAKLEAARLLVSPARANRWESDWQPVYGDLIQPNPRSVQLHFKIDRVAFERATSGPAEYQLVLAFSQMKKAAPQSVVIYRHFDLPGVGPCWIENSGYSIACRSTEIGPSRLIASSRDGSCSEDLSEPSETCRYSETIGTGLGPLSPLKLWDFSFLRRRNAEAGPLQPGENLNFSVVETVRRFRFQVPLGTLTFTNQQARVILRTRQ